MISFVGAICLFEESVHKEEIVNDKLSLAYDIRCEHKMVNKKVRHVHASNESSNIPPNPG